MVAKKTADTPAHSRSAAGPAPAGEGAGRTAKKAAAKKAAAKRTAAGKTAAAPAKKAAKKAAKAAEKAVKKPAKKAPAKTAAAGAAKKAAPGRTAAKKSPPTTAVASAPAATEQAAEAAAKQTGARTVGTKKTAARSAAGVPTARAAAATAPGELAVRPGEDPWTAAEVDEARTDLESEAVRLTAEITSSESALAGLMRDSGDGAGDDEADTGTKNITREHEMALAANAREMLEQTERALERLDAGTYGLCESCGNPIGKARMQAFPRATLCVECKQKQERRG
ncbi:TraR/DksA family transcriptional regulator [Streptomyces zhihengii]|uniref:TraR/DksA family transcriptional regulator n=1 Tax=Streptomyces zhihengii TaxID=1818004 RepID=A0ABS2UX12_9ACTN|nr:TraR/DksA family transcriptional regulator [Streptomyces zhihengii]MBM9622117.1 TraR/DksA family transcriptional regulator [Streptomyces zhihengii]